LVWWFWPGTAAPTAEAKPEPPSPLDVFDPDTLSESAWPRQTRPKEAVGVLEFDKNAAPLRVKVEGNVIRFLRADKEISKIDGYVPPPPPKRPPVFVRLRDGSIVDINNSPMELSRGPTNSVSRAVLAPAGNGLVVFGRTTPGNMDFMSRAADWIQVWVAEGSSLKPLKVQVLADGAARAAAFSPDGTLLAISTGDYTEVWQVQPEGIKYLFKLSASGATDFAFSADNRWLAVVLPDHITVYGHDLVLPGDDGERFRHNLLWGLLSFGVAASALVAARAVMLNGAALMGLRNRDIRKLATRESGDLKTCDLCAGTGWLSAGVGGTYQCFTCQGRGKGPVCKSGNTVVPTAETPSSRWGHRLGVGAFVAALGGVVCLAWWGRLTFFAEPAPQIPPRSSLAESTAPTPQTPPGSPLVESAAKAVSFSRDGRSLAAVLPSGDLAAFDVQTGAQTGKWSMPEKVAHAEYAPDGRHLLGIADRKAYVLRLRTVDEAAYMLTCCEAELKDNPDSVDALMARGLAYREKKDLNRAIADFSEAILRDVSNATAYYQRGLTRADAGDLAGARADLAEAVRLDPGLDPDAKPASAPKQPAPLQAAPAKEGAAKDDAERLQGTWYQVAIVRFAKRLGEDPDDTITYSGNQFTVKEHGVVTLAGTFEIVDAAGEPKQVDLICTVGHLKGKRLRAIYRFEGDCLETCADDGTDKRPKEFSGDAGFYRKMKRQEP
jgi:uncharacterized protein (TIGR03067 family)